MLNCTPLISSRKHEIFYDAYREGKDWRRVAKRESEKIATAALVTGLTDLDLVVLGLTPVGWVAILAVGIFEAGEIMSTNHYIDRAYT